MLGADVVVIAADPVAFSSVEFSFSLGSIILVVVRSDTGVTVCVWDGDSVPFIVEGAGVLSDGFSVEMPPVESLFESAFPFGDVLDDWPFSWSIVEVVSFSTLIVPCIALRSFKFSRVWSLAFLLSPETTHSLPEHCIRLTACCCSDFAVFLFLWWWPASFAVSSSFRELIIGCSIASTRYDLKLLFPDLVLLLLGLSLGLMRYSLPGRSSFCR